MKLETIINEDIKNAMLKKEKKKLEALRSVKNAIIIAKTKKSKDSELSKTDEISLLQKQVKQRKDSAEIYKTQNKTEMYEQEIFEANIISKYLPEQLSEEEVTIEIEKIIKETVATSMKDIGRVIAETNKKLKGKAEGKTIALIVKKLLS